MLPHAKEIFCEEFCSLDSSAFDKERDKTLTARALGSRKLHGFCNVCSTDSEFIISSDNLREDLTSSACSSINRHRQLVCGVSMALFRRPDASLGEIAAHIDSHNWRVYIAEAHS